SSNCHAPVGSVQAVTDAAGGTSNRSSHPAAHRQVRQELTDLPLPVPFYMLIVQVPNKPLHPAHIRSFGRFGMMENPQPRPHRSDGFGLTGINLTRQSFTSEPFAATIALADPPLGRSQLAKFQFETREINVVTAQDQRLIPLHTPHSLQSLPS